LILTIYDRFKIRKVEYFSNFQLSLGYDQFGSTFSFSFYFDPNNPDHKELACVTHYHTCTVQHNDEILMRGFALSQGFTYNPEKQLATISGYSTPGILEDCVIPPDLYPLQSDGVSLFNIAEKLTQPWKLKYGLNVVVDPSVADRVNKPFKKITASEGSTIASFLAEMAQQKRVIVSHNEKGELLLTEAKTTGAPLIEFDFTQGLIPGTDFQMSFDGQGMHSHIYVMGQASPDGGNAREAMVMNPYCPIVYRPTVVSQSSGDDIDSNEVAMRALASELEGLTLKIETDRWIVDGKIIKPNNIITIIAPELYIYKKATWFIRSIDFTGDAEKTTATLNCVIPEVVNGKYPVSIFQGINMHA